jgi:hypothetical protein
MQIFFVFCFFKLTKMHQRVGTHILGKHTMTQVRNELAPTPAKNKILKETSRAIHSQGEVLKLMRKVSLM